MFGRGGEVVVLLPEVDIGDKCCLSDDFFAEVFELFRIENDAGAYDSSGDHDDGGREDAPNASCPELTHAEGVFGNVFDDYRCDEVSRDNKENVNTNKATRKAKVEVEEYYGYDSERS